MKFILTCAFLISTIAVSASEHIDITSRSDISYESRKENAMGVPEWIEFNEPRLYINNEERRIADFDLTGSAFCEFLGYKKVINVKTKKLNFINCEFHKNLAGMYYSDSRDSLSAFVVSSCGSRSSGIFLNGARYFTKIICQ